MLSEPDAYFYVQSAALVGNRVQLDFTNDPPPDIVAEVDINHDSLSKFPFHAALGMTEIWRYDGQSLVIYRLEQDHYMKIGSEPGPADAYRRCAHRVSVAKPQRRPVRDARGV